MGSSRGALIGGCAHQGVGSSERGLIGGGGWGGASAQWEGREMGSEGGKGESEGGKGEFWRSMKDMQDEGASTEEKL